MIATSRAGDDNGMPSREQDSVFNAEILVRWFGWSMLAILVVFLLNNYLTYWQDWPGAFPFGNGSSFARAWVQSGLYLAAIVYSGFYVLRTRGLTLRSECERARSINSFLIRAAFWAVLLIGLVDFGLAFLRGEELLEAVSGKELAMQLTRSDVRGPYVHIPLVALSLVIAFFTRSIGVIWLALLIVVAELLIVMSRFVFSYEQVYMTDLVRFWYASLFLFGCAYTLRKEGHVRVDVFYSNFTPRKKGLVNAIGTLLLGMPFCWLLLAVGFSSRTGVINAALLQFEIEGLGDGLFILYLMTVFMGVFAILMLVEFVGFLFNAVADYRHSPGDSGADASVLI